MGIFDKRINYKPFEYPEIMDFVKAIQKSYWVHDEVDFTADIQDFHSNLTPVEQEVIKRSLLSIAQVEIGVKTFWGKLYDHLPKPEFNVLGSTFSESESRHSEAYSRLLEVLGYNDDFIKLLDVPVFKKRLDIIEKHLKTETFLEKILFFTIVVENASLFSQFANILSFTRFKGYMKNTSNIIAWTSIDEDLHSKAGVFIYNTIIKEVDYSKFPSYSRIVDENITTDYLKDYINQESELLDWIYENGELDFFSKEDILNFMKYRVDESLKKMNLKPIFNITSEQYKPMAWFEEEVFSNELDDFFAKRPTAYTKHDKPITKNDLF